MAYTQKLLDLFSTLNPYQVTAVNAGAGRYALVGAPGSGKTRTITARMARLAADGFNPDYILAMTFTRAAAAEMNDRLRFLEVTGARVGTIHSVCRQIIAADTDMLGKVGLDQKGSMGYELKAVMSDMRRRRVIPNTGVDLESVRRYIEACKLSGPCYVAGNPFGMNVFAETFLREQAGLWGMKTGLARREMVDVFIELERRRATRRLYDFDDMLQWAWLTLINDPESLHRWRSRWALTIVDEAQDSCPLQWDVARLISGMRSALPIMKGTDIAPKATDGEHNMMVAGQVAQSVYGWRAASPQQFMHFIGSKNVTCLELPKNYRSNARICTVASKLVDGYRWAIPKVIEPVSQHDPVSAIRIQSYDSAEQEAESIVDQCLHIAANEGGLRACAVLGRLRVSLDWVELACIRRRIKYVKLAAGSFADAKEVRDILAYLRVASGADPTGEWAQHIINRPFRFIGKPFIKECVEYAYERNVNILDAIKENYRKLKSRQRRSMDELFELLLSLNADVLRLEKRHEACAKVIAELAGSEEWSAMTGNQQMLTVEERLPPEYRGFTPAELIRKVILGTDYVEEIRREEGLMSMDESKIAMLAYVAHIGTFFNRVPDFLAYIDQLRDAVKQAKKAGLRVSEENRDDALLLSTIHAAKGREFKHVFVVDVAQGHFPCSKAEDAEEELRLLYVAITRAEKSCTISYSTGGMNVDSKDQDNGDPVISSHVMRIQRIMDSLEQTHGNEKQFTAKAMGL